MANEVAKKLKPEHEMFAQLYIGGPDTFGNATTSYANAYGLDLNNKKDYRVANASGNRLLAKASIALRVDELLNQKILNDESVDTELGFVISQRFDLSSKISAIKEYNKLRSRVASTVTVNPIQVILAKYGGGEGQVIDELPEIADGSSTHKS